MARTSPDRWKKAEAAFARILGTNRIPITGRAGSDFETSRFRFEHKLRSRVPEWFRLAWQQLDASQSDKIPVLALTVSRRGYPAERYVVLRLTDFCTLTSPGSGSEDETHRDP
jgi:hypothetical protein